MLILKFAAIGQAPFLTIKKMVVWLNGEGFHFKKAGTIAEISPGFYLTGSLGNDNCGGYPILCEYNYLYYFES